MIDRFTHLFKARSKENSLLSKAKTLFNNKSEVEINGNGTSGYVVKHGANKGKILGHITKKSTNNW